MRGRRKKKESDAGGSGPAQRITKKLHLFRILFFPGMVSYRQGNERSFCMQNRILLVEDDQAIADAVALNLKIVGYDYARFDDG